MARQSCYRLPDIMHATKERLMHMPQTLSSYTTHSDSMRGAVGRCYSDP